MSPIEQLAAHRTAQERQAHEREAPAHEAHERQADERSARRTLGSQVARLERELSGLVAGGFPHVRPGDPGPTVAPHHLDAPRLLTLGELERQRDELVERVRRARVQTSEREQLVRRSRALLEDFRCAPARHKFARLALSDLGEGQCGYWEVRPRLGLIGMLAGWWEVKLSSGCP